ncbi:MAG: glyoxalase [Deltaproteobacteria bacterium]|nr:MAG: glyoxalase [Deltaproteobacteria bacterium]
MSTTLRPFHLACPTSNLARQRKYYNEVIGCTEGRSSETWCDFNFFGHQLVFHELPGFSMKDATNPVDGHDVPLPHFGVVLTMDDWRELRDRLVDAETDFIIEPYIRFEGQPGEQATLFFRDPDGYALEFKAFDDDRSLFQKE